jgi:hypothetical protein
MKPLLLLLLAVSLPLAAGEPPLHGITLPDHLDQPHDLERETRARLVLLFTIAARVDAKAWDDSHLPVGRPLVRVLDAGAIAQEDRPRLKERVTKALEGTGVLFVMDYEGVVRKRLGGLADQALVVAIDAEGAETGRVTGLPSAANRTTALGLIGIVPDPPLVDEPIRNPKTDARHLP